MNKNRVNGTIDEVAGIAKRKTGEIVGNPSLQVKGAAQQVKGKLENAVGKANDAIDKSNRQANSPRDTRP
ncbi:MAG: CsbD family protein [Terracidiphilus sp.]|jgi:uncharacterized protein YjbJ (UPF0337 family)